MMNAYQRPLFRQAGGPAGIEALPPPPPAGVAALPQQDPQAMVEAAGQMASSEMESVGQDYVLEMVNSLDNAENFKTVIDALRGNKLPLDERFAELAEYVGEDDAEKTPESVLAMVQPVIMMTEEGNVDSGIGQLMQSLTGEVDMVTEEGDLTDMGQGVGSLMVANQEAPPPQRFADGGAVQHFANGSPFGVNSAFSFAPGYAQKMQGFAPPTDYDPRALQSAYEQRLPMYMGILDPEKERQMTQSQIMFDIAQAGLNLAGGVDPRTGQSMTQLPVASQIATAAGGLPGQISSRLANQRQSEQAAKLAALGAAESQQTARDAAIAAQRLKMADTVGSVGQTVMREEGADTRLRSQLDASLNELNVTIAGLDRRQAVTEKGLGERQRFGENATMERLRSAQQHAEDMQDDDQTHDLERIDVLYQNAIESREDIQAHDTGMQQALFGQQGLLQRIDQEHALKVQQNQFRHVSSENEANRAFENIIFQHQKQMYEDTRTERLARMPGLDPVTFGQALFDPDIGFSDWLFNRSEQDIENDFNFALRKLDQAAAEQQIDLTARGFNRQQTRGEYQDWLQNRQLEQRNYQINSQNSLQLMGMMYDQKAIALQAAMAAGQQPEFSSNQMNALLSDPTAIQAYARGAAMPEVEYALSQRFKVGYDPETGLRMSADLPTGWQAAISAREELGFAVPDVDSSRYSLRPSGGLYGNADGGEIKKMQGGGDPRGAYEPITGTYLPFRDRREDEPVPIENPLITATGEGLDITAAVGSDAALMNIFNTASEAVTGILGGPGLVLGEHYQEAARALDSFNQIALTRALGSIAGKENRELQERLARLEVPAASFVYGDRKALSQFQTSSRVMDFAIREQEAALRGPSLTRTERNKASKDLAALQGIKLEYDRLADAFSRKIEGETADVSTRLDAFFN